MTDFWDDSGQRELWIDYYGSYAHPDHTCGEIGKTRRLSATDRPVCPECGQA